MTAANKKDEEREGGSEKRPLREAAATGPRINGGEMR